MLLQLITSHPEAIGTILQRTPTWVWGLFAGLLALGISQLRDGNVGMLRVTVMPVAMTGFSIWGVVSAFASSPDFGYVVMAWFTAAAVVAALVAPTRAPATFDPVTRRYATQGSWVPLALIAGIFLTKYAVGVEMAMQPQLAHDGQFTLIVATVYGLFNGFFIGRSLRLWRLALQPSAGLRTQNA